MVEMTIAEEPVIALAMQSETVMVPDVSGSYARGVEAGKQEEYDRFWDNYQENGKRAKYQNAFTGSGWNDETFRPKYDIAPSDVNGGIGMFHSCEVTDIQKKLEENGVILDTSKVYLTQTFQYAKTKRIGIVDMSANIYASVANYAFYSAAVETIDKLIVRANVQFSKNVFQNCANLKNLTVEGVIGVNNFDVHWSANLSKASIISIIGALSATTSGLAVTLSAAAVANAFGNTSADQWKALVATKPNWTISLV